MKGEEVVPVIVVAGGETTPEDICDTVLAAMLSGRRVDCPECPAKNLLFPDELKEHRKKCPNNSKNKHYHSS